MSYSLPIDATVSKDELLRHLHTRPDRPNAIPYEFKFYQRDWGLCIQHAKLPLFTQDQYRVFIDAHFEAGEVAIGECTISGESEKTIVLAAHLDHPAMVNDDLSGVAVLTEIAKYLLKRKNRYTYKLLFIPETIGSIAYLSQNENIIPHLHCGIFLEMLGNDHPHSLQLSRQGNVRLDRIARTVLAAKAAQFSEGAFRTVVGNDEMVFNGPGVDMPMISISRAEHRIPHYPEYHTSDDTPDIISEARLLESRDLIIDILKVIDQDYIPKRCFRGPVFLSGFGLWVDWRINHKLNKSVERMMTMLEGEKSVFEIAEELQLDFETVKTYLDKFSEHGLIDKIY